MAKDKLLLEKIKKQINKAKVVSFDIFDTLLVRPYVRPVDLFEHMEKAYERPGFAAERKDAERRTRIRHKELEDVTFDMIYDEIDDEFKDMKQKEMDWEEMVLRANPELKQVYDYALAQGKKVIITSDMYLPTAFLAKVLRKNGYDNWDKLYVSGDVGKRKGTGALFEHLLEDNNISPKDVLHIGDNEKSDMNKPQTMGIATILYIKISDQFTACSDKIKYFREKRSSQLGASILVGFFAYKWMQNRCIPLSNNYWQKIGYQYTGPLAYAFVRFVEKEAKENNINHLLFAARSGCILQKVFNLFQKKIKNTYVYAPRLLKLVCYLKFDTHIEYDKLVDYFCKKSKKIEEKFNIQQNKSMENLKFFIDRNRDLFEEVASSNTEKYKDYLSGIILPSENVALVDDSANTFSGQFNIEQTLGKKIKGYYITVLDTKYTHLYNYSAFHQTIGRDAVKKTDFSCRSWCWAFVEFLLSAPEHPIIDVPGKEIVHSKNNDAYEMFRYEVSTSMHNGATDFTQDILSLFNYHDAFIEFRTIMEWLNSFLLNHCKEDYKNWQKIKFEWFAFNSDRHNSFSKNNLLKHFIFRGSAREVDSGFFWKPHIGLLYDDMETSHGRNIRIMGIPIYRKEKLPNKIKTKILFGLIKRIEILDIKKIYFLGIRVCKKSKRRDNCTVDRAALHNSIVMGVQRSLSIASLHQKTFNGYKNKYQYKSIVLVGAGPTVNFYHPINNTINVGLNRAFLKSEINFDYLFSIDRAGLETAIENYSDAFFRYHAVKFVGDQNLGKEFQIPESVILKYENVFRYKTTACLVANNFALDLESQPLGNYASVALQAIQFILYTNPAKVYLVGIDCTAASQQHFLGAVYDNANRKENLAQNDKTNIAAWKKLKEFAETYYPETEIISINPIGLKGMFRDVYTKEFLRKHPEIDEKSVEIINTENKE